MPKKRTIKQGQASMAHPPVQEVVFHIHAVVPVPPDLVKLKAKLKSELKKDLPIAEDFNLFRHTVQHGGTEAPKVHVDGGLWGLRFRNKEGTHVAHFTPQGLVVNWLQPYPGYAKCLPRVKALWALYEKHFNPIAIETVSMRYLDRINVPLVKGSVNLSDYIKLGPLVPAVDGLSVAGFNQVAEFQKSPENIHSRVSLATLNAEGATLPVLIDHEAFISFKGQHDRSAKAIWPAFEKAHTWSTTFFQASLTAKCLALFE